MEVVTGATGFIGAHVARALTARGGRVRCLVRPGSNRANLAGLPVEFIEGRLEDPATLKPALAGCRVLYHCAAEYRLGARRPASLYRSNVEGTRNILYAAGEAGVGRVVYTSTVGTLAPNPAGGPAHEAHFPSDEKVLVGHYKRSKYRAERVALEFAAQGLPVVIVSPSTPVGDLDRRPTPTGRMIVDFLRGRMPAYVETGLNLIDVRDVAAGHLLAAGRGEVGERYILGNRDLSLRQIFKILAAVSGRRAPTIRIPVWVALTAAWTSTAWSWSRGRDPGIPVEGVRMARKPMFFDARKAIRDLGLPQSPVEDALERAVLWFRREGYVPA